jgi:hypothetical protein
MLGDIANREPTAYNTPTPQQKLDRLVAALAKLAAAQDLAAAEKRGSKDLPGRK